MSNETINVLHIASGKVWGGPEEYAYGLASRLRHDPRFYLEVICRKYKPVLTHFRRLEIPISILPLKGKTDFESPIRFARLLRKGKNIVHVHSFTDAFAAALARRISENKNTRIVLTLHHITQPKQNYLWRKLYKVIDRYVFVSQLAHDTWMSAAKNFDASRAVIIRHSVQPNPLAQPAPDLRQTLRIPADKVLLMFHGRIAEEKGIEVLLRAVAQLDKRTFHLAIVGEGKPKYMARLKGFIVANQLVRNVSFVGFCEDIIHVVEQADIGVLPSVVPETLGLANLEYMMMGRAHITTNNGAQQEYARDAHNALLVPPDNHLALAAAILQLINNPEQRRQIGNQAKIDFDNNLNYDIFYNRITDLYTDLFAK